MHGIYRIETETASATTLEFLHFSGAKSVSSHLTLLYSLSVYIHAHIVTPVKASAFPENMLFIQLGCGFYFAWEMQRTAFAIVVLKLYKASVTNAFNPVCFLGVWLYSSLKVAIGCKFISALCGGF